MNPYVEYVKAVKEQFEQAKELRPGGAEPCRGGLPQAGGTKALLFSPHPDDECITGLLPLRLIREAGMEIINVPVTYGSNAARQAERAEELKAACAYLGFRCQEQTAGRPAGAFHPLETADLVDLLETNRPQLVFMPHIKDWNSRHISTHHLVMDALNAMPAEFSCTVIETEYWGAMNNPNLMVEGDVQTVADLIAAVSFHAKEVERNPYHVLLPAWMQDNVRRGGELVGGQGGAVPDFTFATLYRRSLWKNHNLVPDSTNRIVSSAQDEIRNLFEWK